MSTNYFITYNGETSRAHGLTVEHRPSVPSAAANVTEFTIPGRDGVLHRDVGTVQDVEIVIEFALFGMPEKQFAERFRQATKWLYAKTDQRLFLSDDPNWYYRVVRVEIGDNVERAHRNGGRFSATFTVRGYVYAVSGNSPTRNYTNHYDTCRPLYCITGDGYTTLTVNGESVTVNVGQAVNIDTDKMVTYRPNGTLANAALNGDYEKLWLKPGENTISISSGMTLTVYPRWRKRL